MRAGHLEEGIRYPPDVLLPSYTVPGQYRWCMAWNSFLCVFVKLTNTGSPADEETGLLGGTDNDMQSIITYIVHLDAF